MNPVELAAEALVWESGAYPKRPPSQVHAMAAGSILGKIQRSIKRTMRAATPAPFVFDKAPKNIEALCSDALDPDEAAMLSTGVPDEIAPAYIDALSRCRTQASVSYPRYEMPGTSAAEVAPLSADDTASCWSVVRLLLSPDRVLEEIASWTITRAQVTAFRESLPELSEAIDDAIATELVDMVAAGKDINWQMRDVIGTWRGVPAETPIVTSKPPPAAPPAPTASPGSANDKTPEQAAQFRRQKT
jgi:hypothetical protein